VRFVDTSHQPVHGPADHQGEDDGAADDDQRAQYVLHALDGNRLRPVMNM
jgi:hypothetical protein